MFEWCRQQCIELLSMFIQAGQWRELVLVRAKNNIASRQYRSIIIIIVDFSIVVCSSNSAHDRSLNGILSIIIWRSMIRKKQNERKKKGNAVTHFPSVEMCNKQSYYFFYSMDRKMTWWQVSEKKNHSFSVY
jgi:chlorite dismutase